MGGSSFFLWLDVLYGIGAAFFLMDVRCSITYVMLKNAWLYVDSSWKLKWTTKSDIEGSSIFLSSFVNFSILVSLFSSFILL